jgi:hypothetical protein
MKKHLLLFFILLSIAQLNAQVILSESFDGTTFAPTGWYNTRISPGGGGTFGFWDRVTSATGPDVLPHSGAGMARFNSPSAGFGTITELGTLPLNFSSGGPYRVKFWLYRGDNAPFGTDMLDVYVNTAANITGATQLTRIFISRTQDPQEPVNGWYQYQYDIAPSYNTAVNYIIFRATGRSSNIIYLDDVTVEAYNCYRPTNVISSNLAATSVDFSWTAPVSGSTTGYDWELRTNGSPGSGSTGLALSGSAAGTSVSLSGLMQGFQYKFYVRSSCSGIPGSWTAAVTVTMPCTSFPLPYTQNFDGAVNATGLPPCTNIGNPDGGNTWRSTDGSYGSTYSHSLPTAIYCQAGGGSFGTPGNDWFFTAPLSLETGKCYDLSFFYRTNITNESMEVKMGMGQDIASMGTTLFTRSNFQEDNYQPSLTAFTVPATGIYYIGFRCSTTIGSSNGLFVDDISVTEVCGVPASLNVTGISTNSATLNWTAPPCGIPLGYDWEIRTSGAAGSGAVGLAASGNAASVTTGISGLQEGTNYNFYIRTVCSVTTNSSWSGAYSFKTACSNRSLPYSENFDAIPALTLPPCVTVEDVSGTSTWVVATNRPRSAPNCMIIEWFSSSGMPHNDWFFTPPFNLTAGTSYRLVFHFSGQFPDDAEALEIKYGTAPNAAAMTSAAIYSNTNIINPLFKQAIVDFTPSADGAYHIGFHSISPLFSTYLRIDDIVFDVSPACDSVRNISAADITPVSATMKWDLPVKGTPGGYDWELRTTGLPGSGASGLVSSGILASGTLTVPVAGLTTAGTYYFYIRSDCSGTKGNWVGNNFTTACDAIFPPYVENLDSWTAPALPDCNRTENKDKDGTWTTWSDPLYARSAPNSVAYRFNPYSPADDWFYTRPLNLVAGTSYRLEFYYRVFSSTYQERLEVKLGNLAQATSMTGTVLFNNTTINNTTYQRAVIDFTAAASGVHYIGFHCYSLTNQGDLYIDDISLATLGVCPTTGSFVINAGKTGSNYQWQVNTGGGFVNLTDNANYSGSLSGNLTVANLATSNAGNQYRCIVDGVPTSSFQLRYVLTWNGALDMDWLNPGNWNCASVPDQYIDVIIPGGMPRYPQVSANTIVRSIKTEPGGTVIVQNGVRLELTGQ